MNRRSDTLIVGGGPAGASAAIHLARGGAPVALIERTTGPHDKVCGDFVGGPALAALADLGIDAAMLGGAPTARVRLIAGARMAETALPFPAYGLSRRVLDEALLSRAVAAGALVRRGEAMRGLDSCPPSGTVLLATGKHDLRGAARPAHGSGAVGLKMYLTLAPDQAAALAGAVEMVLLASGYAGLQMVEAGRAVLCVMRYRAAVRARGADQLLAELAGVSAHLRLRLAGAVPLSDRPLAVAGVPYGHLHLAGPSDPPRLYRLGDQAAVIPSLAGEGIAIALASGVLAAECVLAGAESSTYHRQLRERLRYPMRVAMGVHRLACVAPAQPWLLRACQFWPAMIGFTATRTRC
ncbi:MAG: FAD-dependent monooxygenase [Acetobacteraceae bacterium]